MPSVSPGVDPAVLEAFLQFPTPLAVLDADDGGTDVVNGRFRECFGDGSLDPAALRELVAAPSGASRDLPLSGGRTARARAVRMTSHTLVILDDPERPAADVAALQARVAELENLAATDHLTGAWNRAHLDRVIETELARSLAAHQPLSLILFDIDHFKKINDTLGHPAGDAVLRELVALLRSRSRASDVLFRWGGEEFVMLVASAGYRRAEVVAENLREAVASHTFAGAGAVTVSLGVAEHAGAEDAAAWFKRMDLALYEAKETGRNRVVVSRRGDSDTWAAEGGAAALHLTWLEGYECGEPTIDAEHRELFRLANALIDAAIEPAGSAVNDALDTLILHVKKHFSDEEAVLERLGYAQLEEHRRAHAGLLRRAGVLQERVATGQARLGAVVEFLAQDVVARHLAAVDRAFFPLFARSRST